MRRKGGDERIQQCSRQTSNMKEELEEALKCAEGKDRKQAIHTKRSETLHMDDG